MSSFMKLSTIVLNTSQIRKIYMYENKYIIELLSNKMSGYMFYGSGFVSEEKDIVEVCKKNNESDHRIVSDWISCLSNRKF